MRFFVLALASLVASAFATESIITADIFSGRKLQTSTAKEYSEYTPEVKKAQRDGCYASLKRMKDGGLCKGASCTAAEDKTCITQAERRSILSAEATKSIGIRFCGNEDAFGSYFETLFSEVEGCEGYIKGQEAICEAVATCAVPGGGSTTIIIAVVAGVAVVVLAAVGVFLYKKKKSKAKVASQAASGAA